MVAARKQTKSEKLFLKAYHFNWDDGVRGLVRMVKSKDCDRGTALMLYWHATPRFYKDFNCEEEVPEEHREHYRFLKQVEALLLSGRLPSQISYAPDAALIPEDLGNIPPILTQPSAGEVDGQALLNRDIGELQLLKACGDGDMARVQELVDKGFEVDQKINGSMPLQMAVLGNHVDVARFLISRGAPLNKKTGPSGFTLLHWATQSCHLEVANVLLEHGLHVDAKAKWKRTSLHQAVYWDEEMWVECEMEKAVRWLLAHGANPKVQDSEGSDAYDLAKKSENGPAIKLLETLGCRDESS